MVEVTSPSTGEYDRGEKLEHYKRLPSLREVVLVAHGERMVEVIRREGEAGWSQHVGRPGDVVRLASVGCDLSVDDVYRGIAEGS